MRVLHINSGNLYGGIEVMLVTLARHRDMYAEMEPEFAVCFQGRLSQELADTEVAVHILGPARVSRPWTTKRVRRQLEALLETGRFDAVVCHGAWSLCLFGPVVRRRKIPLAMWLHCPPGSPLNWLDRWASWYPPDLTICNSDYTLAGAARLFPGAKATRVYCPVHFPERAFSAEDNRKTRAEFDTREDEVVLLQVGRWEACKGHSLLMTALGLLARLPGWVCWQVGGVQNAREESYLRTIQEAARRNGVAERVRFLGFQNNQTELPGIMAATDVFCQPNIAADSFGITFVEALQAGLPVVATSLGGPVEIVDSTCGVLVPPGDPRALASALRQFIQDPHLRRDLGRNGPRRARLLSDPRARLGQLAGELEKLCHRHVQAGSAWG